MPAKKRKYSGYRKVGGRYAKVARKGRSTFKLVKQVRANTRLLKNTVEGKQIYKSGVDPQGVDSFKYYAVMDGLAQGVADTGTGSTTATGARIGNSINVKSITMKMMINGSNTVIDPTFNQQGKAIGTYRVIVYNSPCGSILGKDDILREAGTTTTAMKSHYQINVAQGKEYEIWLDKLISINESKTLGNCDFVKRWKDGKKVIFNNNTVSPSNFYPRVLVIGMDNVNTDAFHYSFKVRYEDL